MKKTVLITGAAGFIGSHLCDYFIKRNYFVLAIDNLLTGCLENLIHLQKNPNFKFIQIDITSSFVIDQKIDYILHFASPASPIDYLKMPIETMRVGSVGTENILKIALKNNITILVASTSEIYGDPLEHPQNENYYGNVNPIGQEVFMMKLKKFFD